MINNLKLIFFYFWLFVRLVRILLHEFHLFLDKLSEHIYKLKGTNQAKTDQITKLENETSELSRKISSLQKEHVSLKELKDNDHRTNSALRDELNNAKKKLAESEINMKQMDRGKQELKEKALQTLKEYAFKISETSRCRHMIK